MSAHKYGAAGWSERKRERMRQAAVEHERQLRHEREAFLQWLATRLAQECQLSEKVARQRVEALSVSAKRSQGDR